jgi:hypothetical protein
MLKKIFLTVSVLLLSTVCLSEKAQAGPILTQDFQITDTNGDIVNIGSISFDTDNLDEFFPGTGDLLQWETFSLFGFDIDNSSFFVNVGFDPSNIFAGLEYILFDVTDIDMTIAFAGFFDLLDPLAPPFISVFNLTTGELNEFDNFTPGAASVVSAPATFWLMFAAAGAVLMRRRTNLARVV